MSKFTLDLSKFIEKANTNIETCIRKTVIDLGSNAVRLTPVDTGQAAGNWDYGKDTIPATVYETKGPGISIIRMNNVLSQDVIGLHYIANNLPYIEALENGHSGQAPQGMMRLAVANFINLVESNAKGLL